MKICLTSTGENLDAKVDPRFGRCPYLLIVDSETLEFEVIPNIAAGSSGGAGIVASQLIVKKGVKVLITGNIGPNTFRALSASEIEVMVSATGTIREAIEKFKKGELKKIPSPTVGEHFDSDNKGQGKGIWRV